MNKYRAFGLVIHSELSLPRLAVSSQLQPDVVIRIGKVSEHGLQNAVLARPFLQVKDNTLWLQIKDVARFLVRGGNCITVEPLPNADMQAVCLYVLGSCLGAIIHQRGQLIWHANAINIGGSAIAVAGPSGVGKSTLAASFMQLGYPVLADDLVVVDDQQRVIPSYPQIKLWQDSANMLGINTAGMERIRLHKDKFECPLGDAFCENPVDLRLLVLLERSDNPRIKTIAVHGSAKLLACFQQIYRRGYLAQTAERSKLMQACVGISQRLVVYRLQFSAEHHLPLDCANELVALSRREARGERREARGERLGR